MRFLSILFLLISCISFAQEDIVAREYFIKGDFEKAKISYQKLYNKNKNNRNYLLQLIKTEQQLELYNDVEALLLKTIEKKPIPSLYVELGYNYKLKEDSLNANKYYNKAIATINERPNNAYAVGRAFESHSLLDQAIISYNNAMDLSPNLDFNIQLSKIYGEQGNIEKMFLSYTDLAQKNISYMNTIKRAFSEFISEQSDNKNNIILKKIFT